MPKQPPATRTTQERGGDPEAGEDERQEREKRGMRKGPDKNRKSKEEAREVDFRESWLCLRCSSTAPPKSLPDTLIQMWLFSLNPGVLSAVLYRPLQDSRKSNIGINIGG